MIKATPKAVIATKNNHAGITPKAVIATKNNHAKSFVKMIIVTADESEVPKPGQEIDVDVCVDTSRSIQRSEEINIDTKRLVGRDIKDISAGYDTQRQIAVTTESVFDMCRDILIDVIVNADTRRFTSMPVTFIVDTIRQSGKNVILYAGLEYKNVVSFEFEADTIRRIPVIMNNNQLKSISISIDEQTVTDIIALDVVDGSKIMPKDTIKGSVLDYNYEVLAKEVSNEYGAKIANINTMANFYNLSYEKKILSIQSDSKYVKVNRLFPILSKALGCHDTKILLRDNFSANIEGKFVFEKQGTVSGSAQDESGNTAKGVSVPEILSFFIGWSKTVPYCEINAFIREGVLWVIERGKEPKTVNLDGRNITRPMIRRTLLRNYAEIHKFGDYIVKQGWVEHQVNPNKPVEKIDDNTTMLYDENGRPMRSKTSNPDGSYREVSYSYDEEGKRGTTKVTQSIVEGDNQGNITHSQQIDTSLNNGMAYTSHRDDNHVEESSSISTSIMSDYDGAWTERYIFHNKIIGIMCYTYDSFGNYVSMSKLGDIRTAKRPDNQFGIDEASYKKYFDELCKMNGKTEEVLTFDIVDPVINGKISNSHIIDFRDVIIFKGNTYYLQHNNVRYTPTEFRQSLQIVRWF